MLSSFVKFGKGGKRVRLAMGWKISSGGGEGRPLPAFEVKGIMTSKVFGSSAGLLGCILHSQEWKLHCQT